MQQQEHFKNELLPRDETGKLKPPKDIYVKLSLDGPHEKKSDGEVTSYKWYFKCRLRDEVPDDLEVEWYYGYHKDGKWVRLADNDPWTTIYLSACGTPKVVVKCRFSGISHGGTRRELSEHARSDWSKPVVVYPDHTKFLFVPKNEE